MRSSNNIIIALAMCSLAQLAWGQSLDQALFRLQKASSDVADKPLTPLQKPILESIQSNINVIQSRTSQLPDEDKSLYSRSLRHNANLLDLAAKESDSGKANGLLAEVEADLKIKSSAQVGMAMASRFNGRVSVSVNTWKSGNMVSGYIINLNPMYYAGTAPFIRLEKQSSPAAGKAPPGRYYLIAVKDGIRVSKEIVQIGLNAQDVAEFDVQIP